MPLSPEGIDARLRAATAEELDLFAIRVVRAERLTDVFGS